ncbi:MAG: hypothetical protein R3B57_02805 [Phycisphaerales bacterium]
MNDVLNFILGLTDIRFGGADTRFELARAIPAWAWAAIALVCVAVAVLGYRRLIGARAPRGALAVVRTLVLLLIVLLALGPRLVRERSRTERDWVVVLADRSASMSIADAPGGVSRDEQLAQALAASGGTWRDIASRKRILWLGFDAGAFELGTPEGGATPTLGEADGLRTAIGDSIDQALRRVAARPVSGVVLLSDGRSAAPVDRSVRRRLESDQIPVFSVPLGSPEPATDLAVRRVEAPEVAFVKDTAPVRVEIERLGSGEVAPGARIEVVDAATGITLAERELGDALSKPDATTTELTLTPKVESVGRRSWVVRLVPGGRDLVPENNEQEVAIELVDRPLRVLYLDGYPRWDARYLRSMLLRESTIRSSGLLLAPDRQYTQEGDIAITRLPVSPSEWEEYDVVILGDLSPELFGSAQLEALREHIAARGAGLLWIAGPGHTPEAWFDSPLADLLPVRRPAGAAGAPARLPVWGEAVTLERTPEGERLGVLAMSDDEDAAWPARLSDPATGWSRLRWAQRIDADRVKPAAETLAAAIPESRFTRALLDDGGAGALAAGSPAVLTMRYGAGRIVYVATDEIWRWRYGRGEDLPERFWLPIVRMLGREGLTRSGRSALLVASPERAETGAPIRIGLELLDQSLVDAAPASIRIELTAHESGGAPVELRLAPEGSAGAARSYAVAWATSEPGLYDVRVTEPLLAPFGLTTTLEVARPDDERRHPETDHPSLASLAAQTGGKVIAPTDLAQLASALPNREQVFTGPREIRTLWDRPIALILLISLLVLEWVGRRLIRLA